MSGKGTDLRTPLLAPPTPCTRKTCNCSHGKNCKVWKDGLRPGGDDSQLDVCPGPVCGGGVYHSHGICGGEEHTCPLDQPIPETPQTSPVQKKNNPAAQKPNPEVPQTSPVQKTNKPAAQKPNPVQLEVSSVQSEVPKTSPVQKTNKPAVQKPNPVQLEVSSVQSEDLQTSPVHKKKKPAKEPSQASSVQNENVVPCKPLVPLFQPSGSTSDSSSASGFAEPATATGAGTGHIFFATQSGAPPLSIIPQSWDKKTRQDQRGEVRHRTVLPLSSCSSLSVVPLFILTFPSLVTVRIDSYRPTSTFDTA